MPTSTPPVVLARDLEVALGGRPVLEGVSFHVEDGDAVAVVGPNGAGKTTLLRAIAGLIPHTGTLELRGRDVADWKARARAREVALVRQQTDLSVAFTAAEVVALGRSPHLGWTEGLGTDDDDRVRRALEAVDLADLAHRPVTELSGGEQQRVALAQALAQDAGLLLLDEPTAHLDVRHQLDLQARLSRLVLEGRTVVAAVHDLELAARFATRLWVLHQGRLVADGPPTSILTSGLLRDVFGVNADVEVTTGEVRVRYLDVAR
ncbi:ABC transporter ATP-binding protein [Rubrivirga sp.]|uniref:ABC transporter ATP-binding protein n=1 Tax=Rubrivirga sp. TaxID=1885344 RepID=UPI003C74AFA1